MNVARVDELSKFFREKLPIPTVGDAPHQHSSFLSVNLVIVKRSFQPQ